MFQKKIGYFSGFQRDIEKFCDNIYNRERDKGRAERRQNQCGAAEKGVRRWGSGKKADGLAVGKES
jgi:hypothetical protein